MNLEYIKLALGLNDDSKDILLSRIHANVERAVCLYLNISTNVTPQELEWIVEECTIIRYNRVGSEGIVQESIDSLSMTYQADFLKEYYPYLDAYKSRNMPAEQNKNRLRMI
ncbi:phage head-tail connector protein [Cytobacillus kochii]|uniref:phage head-tail connector protein n=1 Tax=Cytobacillus kochii TaxID=859143 RepID=UPI001CD2A339|nr:phage head-tail connector protein [Cytobacillus kochii]MCA1025782.1 phage head-tail connector protein [Cytobacillus kochii]